MVSARARARASCPHRVGGQAQAAVLVAVDVPYQLVRRLQRGRGFRRKEREGE